MNLLQWLCILICVFSPYVEANSGTYRRVKTGKIYSIKQANLPVREKAATPAINKDVYSSTVASSSPAKTITSEPGNSSSCVTRSSTAICPSNWMSIANGCFRFHTDGQHTFEEAHTVCEGMGGVLAQPCEIEQLQTSANEYVKKNNVSKPLSFWIDAKFNEDNLDYRYHNGYSFPRGDRDDRELWKENHPVMKSGYCQSMFFDKSPLRTVNCKDRRRVICEWLPDRTACTTTALVTTTTTALATSTSSPSCVSRSSAKNCPTNWTATSNGCFQVLGDFTMDFYGAKTACERIGGVIAQPCNMDMNPLYMDVIKKFNTDNDNDVNFLWIGVEFNVIAWGYIYDNGFKYPEGDPLWKDLSMPVMKQGYCMCMNVEDTSLRTQKCKRTKNVICEYISS